MAAGSELAPKPIRPRAWVIRMPGIFTGHDGRKIKGSFQTIVCAPSEGIAWEVAMMSDVWEQLPFQVKNIQIFPKDPLLQSNGQHQAR